MNRKILRISTLFLGLTGVAMLIMVFYPIISYELEARQRYPTLLSPVIKGQGTLSQYMAEKKDYDKASSWFVGDNQEKFNETANVTYNLTIPKLRIENATVLIGGEDLAKSLIQYPGTALPGRDGNTVIFGHSILPIFYNPKNYISIFSTLNKLKAGDNIFINSGNVRYKYEVEELFEVLPTDLDVLQQNQGNSYLTLITCSPPGHPLNPKRLIVRAKIVPYDANESIKQALAFLSYTFKEK